MKALIDADILRYEIGYAAESAWKHSHDDDGSFPSWDYTETCLLNRVDKIMEATNATEATFYFTNGPTFRDQIAVSKPYKGTRTTPKPWHFKNLYYYMLCVFDCKEELGLEADDLMAIAHTLTPDTTIICSRDKDLRQVPGWLYSWEIGKQAEFGPTYITEVGSLDWNQQKNRLTGTGYLFFCAQLIMGDSTDNIPGLPGHGPKAAWNLLRRHEGDTKAEHILDTVKQAYSSNYKEGYTWQEYFTEQAQLLWMIRELDKDGQPVMWGVG